MKHRMTITLDEGTVLSIQDRLRTSARKGIYKNKSHFIEHTINKFLEDDHGTR